LARTTAEHESILDVFDNLLALGYLYISELTINSDLGRLQALAIEVAHEVNRAAYGALFPDEGAKRLAICEVMNRLQKAYRVKEPPVVTGRDEWNGMSVPMDGFALKRIHFEQVHQLVELLVALVDRIETAFPNEAKPFVTPEQVKALLSGLDDGRQGRAHFTGPIQVDILGRLAHQEFLAGLERVDTPLMSPDRALELVHQYARKAERSFDGLVRESFIVAMVTSLYRHAPPFKLPIDKAYSWGALWRQPLSAKDGLDLYARLNRSGAIRDANYDQEIDAGVGIPAAEFIAWGRAMVPWPNDFDPAEVARTYFKSDDADLHINGEPVQKHAVMAVRYDRPLRDVERTLRHFRNYLLRQRKDYCTASGETLNAEEAALAKLFIPDLLHNTKPARAVLHDKSGVLGHLCTLMYMEIEHDPAHAQESKKARVITIKDWVREAGFDYSIESIRKSCARGPAQISNLRARFVAV